MYILDVMDGLFVPNISIGLPVLSCIRKGDGPDARRASDDRPPRALCRSAFCQAGADIVTVHVEADTQENTLEALRIVRACGKSRDLRQTQKRRQKLFCRSSALSI